MGDTPKTPPPPKTILFLAASPADKEPVGNGEEYKQIKDALRGSAYRLVYEPWVTRGEIPSLLLDAQPVVVHFSGHGEAESMERVSGMHVHTAYGSAVLSTAENKADSVPIERIAAVLRHFPTIQCVFLNLCDTGKAVNHLKSVLPRQACIVGAKNQLPDDLAIAFAAAFYAAVAKEMPFAAAFDLAKDSSALLGRDVEWLYHIA